MVRPRSLFWTFAGVFLLVLGAAAAVQLAVSLTVLRPLAGQRLRDHAELALERAAGGLAALGDPGDVPRAVRVLREHRLEDRGAMLVWSVRGGPVVPDRPVLPELHHQIATLLVREGLADPGAARPRRRRGGPPPLGGDAPFPPPDGPPSGDRGFAGRSDGPPRGGDPLGPPRGAGPGERPVGPPRDGGPLGPPDTDPLGPPPADDPLGPPPDDAVAASGALELVGHRAVVVDGVTRGELAVVGPPQSWRSGWLPESRAVLLFLPFAVLAAAAAGLVMVRLLVRRLNALERVTARVTGGDLAARVEPGEPDEIGRLERSFNAMTERLAAARARLEDNDRQRRVMIANITHELATPLTSIRGYVETLADPAVPKTTEEHDTYLRDVLDEAARLDLLVSEMLELTRLEAGANPLKPVRLDWAALCRNAARRFAPRFAEASLALRWEREPGEAWILADGRRMEQVIDNLLANALRYVPAGGTVSLALDRVASPKGERFRLTVSDDGPGLTPGDLAHVFERFYRAESARGVAGTGLGLAIVAEIATQHGGDARAEARAPRGAAFVVELPAAA